MTANGIRIHYHRTGGGKSPIVLAHGGTDNGLCWIRLAQALELAYDLIMFDARGHGLSEVPESGYRREDHAADLAGLIQALGLARPVLIGHSIGAANVAVAVARDPNLARCAILEDPDWRHPPASIEALAAMAEEWRADVIRRQSQTREVIIVEGRAQSPAWADIEWDPWIDAKRQVSQRYFDFLSRGLPTPWQETVGAITCPTLLITGNPALGAIVTAETAQAVVELCPKVQVAHLDRAGHNVRREQFEKYLEAVRQFLGEN